MFIFRVGTEVFYEQVKVSSKKYYIKPKLFCYYFEYKKDYRI